MIYGEEIKKYICAAAAPLVDAIKIIDRNAMGLIYAVDESGRLAGCLTDGDVRRWIIKNGKLDGRVEDAMNRNPRYILRDEADKSRQVMYSEQIYSVPVTDGARHIIGIIFHEAYKGNVGVKDNKALENVPIVVMAGGKGTRLYPYTKILPKPLVPIGDVPILERILNRFFLFGATEFFITLNYRKEMIKSYFAEIQPPYAIHYVEEECPLGTAGSVRLIKQKFEIPMIITNCDTIIEMDYKALMDYHRCSQNDMTIVSSIKNISIPYGVIHSEASGIITAMEEKPQHSFFINTGMYVVNPDYLDWIPEDGVFHMTDLAQMMIEKGRQVGMYPISENSFLDMGEFEEMKRMEERLSGGYIE